MKARVTITPRPAVLDPQGRAVLGSLHTLGFDEVRDVRIGRSIEVTLDAAGGPEAARARLDAMCRELLANTLIEDYRFEIEP
jgi:phosphoribosylformylglycinamidine synthase